MRRSVGVRHFALIAAMKQNCGAEARLYEFFLAFENLTIGQVFADINVVFSTLKDAHKAKTAKRSHMDANCSEDDLSAATRSSCGWASAAWSARCPTCTSRRRAAWRWARGSSPRCALAAEMAAS